jgi:hypothetical protein
MVSHLLLGLVSCSYSKVVLLRLLWGFPRITAAALGAFYELSNFGGVVVVVV